MPAVCGSLCRGSFSSIAEDTVIVDARSEAQYSGRERHGRRAGHIPRSVSVLYNLLLGPRGIGFADDNTLARRLYDAGLLALDSGAQKAVLSYCIGGVASTSALFALGAWFYPGSVCFSTPDL
jgi:3-mercaptopyruvate sulfurtransferase SseA